MRGGRRLGGILSLVALILVLDIAYSDEFEESLKARLSSVSRIPATSIFNLGNESDTGDSVFSERSKMKPIRRKGSKKFRSAVKSARRLDSKLSRWDHKDKIIPSEPEGCGCPICVVLEARIKRFPSICALFKFMVDNSMQKTVIKVQKGGCEDAIEGKRYDSFWGQSYTNCHACSTDDKYGCNQKVCLHIGGVARTFDNVCEGLKWLGPKKDVIKIAVGLGDCKTLYSKCIYTDWFDLEDPCNKGDYEHYEGVKNMFIDTGNGIQNFCPKGYLEGSLQGATLDGIAYPDNVTFQVIQEDLALQCLNEAQPARALAPYYWSNQEVRCRDFKVRFCCRLLYGTPVALFGKEKVDAISLDPPDLSGKTLFDHCEWRSFISSDYAVKKGDVETRAVHVKFRKTSACGSSTKTYAMIIDARLRSNDTPADETKELITKYTPWFGFYCDNINNKPYGKKCSDYKVRYCCAKLVQEAAQWGDWSDYSRCTKSCGGGTQERSRACIKKRGNKKNCFGILEDRFSKQKRECRILPCPKEFRWTEWWAWTQCSASCGDGSRHRVRGCHPPSHGGQYCPPPGNKHYKEAESCSSEKCADPQWIKWQNWASCSKSCGAGIRTRERICIDVNNYNRPSSSCPGPKEHEEACFDAHCPIDGGWSKWQSWGECNRACGEGGKRPRFRYCINPFPKNAGKECEGTNIEYGPCEVLKPCPVHCLYSEWGAWSPCTVSCGKGPGVGTMERNRHIHQEAKYGGIQCSGITKDIRACIHCNFTEGVDQADLEICIPYCPIDCLWEEWGQVTGKCVVCWADSPEKFPKAVAKLRSRRKSRYVIQPPAYNGKECSLSDGQPRQVHMYSEELVIPCKVSDDVETSESSDFDTYRCAKGVMKGMPYFAAWSMWGVCTAVCGKDGIQTRTRRCVGGNKDQCEKSTKLNGVQTMPCPSVCAPPEWSMWESWSKCEVTCGIGQVARRRTCLADGRHKKFKASKVNCGGIEREQRKCDMGKCGSHSGYSFQGNDTTGIAGQDYGTDYKTSSLENEKDAPTNGNAPNETSPSSLPTGENSENTVRLFTSSSPNDEAMAEEGTLTGSPKEGTNTTTSSLNDEAMAEEENSTGSPKEGTNTTTSSLNDEAMAEEGNSTGSPKEGTSTTTLSLDQATGKTKPPSLGGEDGSDPKTMLRQSYYKLNNVGTLMDKMTGVVSELMTTKNKMSETIPTY